MRTVDLDALIHGVAADLPDLGRELAVPVALPRASRNLLKGAGAHGVRATARVWCLAIARTIIRGYDGDIRLENRAEGGLRATVVLPGNADG